MSGGSSSQSQKQTFTDNRAVLGEGSNYANNGSSIATTNYVLDNGAIGRSFDTADRALGFAAGAQSDALATAGSALTKALTFAGNAQDGALSTVGDTFSKALTFAGNSQDGALGFGEQALKLVGTQTAAALDNLQETQRLTADAYNDAKGRGAMTDKLLIGAIAAMAIVAFAAVNHGKL